MTTSAVVAMADLHVVTGPPCSGKSHYVEEHAKEGEVRIDLDPIALALGAEEPHGATGGIKSAAIAARQGAIERVIEESIPAWITHCDPSPEQLSAYEDAGAEVIEMDADLETCLARAEADDRPPISFALIREWFERHGEQERSMAPKGAFSLTKEAEMPFKPQDRQYRSFAASNFQSVASAAQDGEQQEPSYTVRGHYTVFDSEYELFPGVYESVAPTALDEADTSDVLFQFNHAGTPLARLRNHSLRIGIDEIGGWAEADLSGCQQGRDIYEAISNGLIDRMSFGFTIADDGFEWYEDDDGNIHSRITKVSKLFDVSCVDMPASDYTDISARNYLSAAIDAKRVEEEAEQAAIMAEEQRRADATALRRRKATALELEAITFGYQPDRA